jgi:hypothetical protein
VDAQAARLLSRRHHGAAQRLRHRALVPGPRVKPREDEQLHRASSRECVPGPDAIIRPAQVHRGLLR